MSSLAWLPTHTKYFQRHPWAQMRIWAMQRSCRCLQSILAALNGAQSSVCCHRSGTQPCHPSAQQWQLTTHGLPNVGPADYTLPQWWSFTLLSASVGNSGLAFHMLPAVYCSWLNASRVNVLLHPKRGETSFIGCVTSIPSISWGMHSFPYEPAFLSLWWAHLRGKGRLTQITEPKRAILYRNKANESADVAFTVGFLSMDL